jgi:Na+-driven multidrug efflux pump
MNRPEILTEAPSPPATARQHALLNGPIVATLLRLALPTVVVMVVQTLVGVAETYFVSFLGTDALAGVALVFPVLMLMQMMSNGGIGGGVASAMARAFGAGRKDDQVAMGEAASLDESKALAEAMVRRPRSRWPVLTLA